MTAVRRGLGKGLDTMIPDKLEAEKKQENVSRETLIDISLVEPNPKQPRKHFNEDKLAELSESIKRQGLVEPIVVRKTGKRYEIVAGERRWRACQQAGIREIPVVIKDYDDAKVFEIALIENIQRQDLNQIEEAMAYQQLIEEQKLTQDEVAERVSKDRSTITNTIRLLKLDQRIQQMIVDEMITAGHARQLLNIEDKELQYEIAMKIFDTKMSVRETEKLVKKIKANGGKLPDDKKAAKDDQKKNDAIYYRVFEDNIREVLGTKIEIQMKDNNKGKLIIDFTSPDDFERIYGIITGGKNNA